MTASEVGVLGTNGRFHFRPLAGLGTQETYPSSDSSPKSSHRDFDSRKRSFPVGRSVPFVVIGKKWKLTFAGWSRQAL